MQKLGWKRRRMKAMKAMVKQIRKYVFALLFFISMCIWGVSEPVYAEEQVTSGTRGANGGFQWTYDISNVTEMAYMFWDCMSLTSLDVSNFDTSNHIRLIHLHIN